MTILCNIVFCFYGFLLFGRNALTRKCASLYFLTLYAHLQSKTRKWKISSSSPENEKLFFFYFLSNYWVVCICGDCILPSYNNFSQSIGNVLRREIISHNSMKTFCFMSRYKSFYSSKFYIVCATNIPSTLFLYFGRKFHECISVCLIVIPWEFENSS